LVGVPEVFAWGLMPTFRTFAVAVSIVVLHPLGKCFGLCFLVFLLGDLPAYLGHAGFQPGKLQVIEGNLCLELWEQLLASGDTGQAIPEGESHQIFPEQVCLCIAEVFRGLGSRGFLREPFAPKLSVSSSYPLA